jgi:NADPH:quinone reductase-like Zn-dependent oxidoreductase
VSDENEALWLVSPRGRFEVRPATRPTAGPYEAVIRVRCVAVNPVDAIEGLLRRVVTPWVRYPTVLGSDVAGEVIAVGEGVTRLRVGDRVLGYAAGQERARNTPLEGAFQRYVTVLERVCTPIPDHVSFEAAAVLPLALATAAAGLYELDQLALPLPASAELPTAAPRDGEVVLVWGASTSVGINAVQLARASGFSVFATAGRHNHELVRSLGAEAVFDYRDGDVDKAVIDALHNRRLAGTVAIGKGSLSHALRIAHQSAGTKRIASAYPSPVTKARALIARRRGIRVSAIWGGTPVESPVGPAVFGDFLPGALADGRFRPAPDAVVAGADLRDIPAALDTLRAGVSAAKLVVSVK